MKVYILFCVMIVLCSCSMNTHIAGKYASKNNPNCFQLNEDSTFIYEYGSFHAYEYSIGKWKKIDKKTIVLNSNVTSTTVPLKVKESEKLNSGNSNLLSVNLNVSGNLDVADYKCEIFINDTLYNLTNDNLLISTGLDEKGAKNEINISNLYFRYIRCDSLSHIQVMSPIHSMYFKFIKNQRVATSTIIALHPLLTEKFFPKRSSSNNIEIETSITDSLFFYTVYNDEKLKLKKNSIQLYNSYTDKWEQIPKVPDTTKIFIRH